MFLLLQVQSVNFPFGSIAPAAINDNLLFACFQAQDVDCPSFFQSFGATHCFYMFCIVSGSKRQFKCVKFVTAMNMNFIVIMVPLGPGR